VLVPAVASLVGFLALFAVRRKAMSVLASSVLFIASVPAGMLLSYSVVNAFSYLLHGDGALAVIAAPIAGAIFSAPVVLIFAVALAIIRTRRV
jgi:hypothetical protein